MDRTWAKDFTDDEFQHEYMRRFPLSDVLPTRESYLASTADQVETIVFPIPEQFERDTGLDVKHLSESDSGHIEAGLVVDGSIFCPDCPARRTFLTAHSLLIHRGIAHKARPAESE